MRAGWRRIRSNGKLWVRGKEYTSPKLTEWAGKEVYVTERYNDGEELIGFVVAASNAAGEILGIFDFKERP
jgi:hypothetical protein